MSIKFKKDLFVTAVFLVLVASSFELWASRERFALEKYDIGQLKVWMIVERNGGKDHFAYVRDPQRFIHHVEVYVLTDAIESVGEYPEFVQSYVH
ncbi:MAG: hypothetical protein ACREPB_01520 [Arenimonas sp.]